jgi:pimeloyl-ACP methyl ester carboxylesterase
MDDLDARSSRILDVNGIRLHVVEEGEGALVILVHGFPESWYSWRRQLTALATAGYRTVAIDVRGYGRSSRPQAIDAYRMTVLVGDVTGLVGALGEQRAVLVGHDWGAPIVWTSALLRPDLFRGVAGLSVPYRPRTSVRPSDGLRRLGGDDEFYIEYFQQPGRAESEIEEDVRGWLLGFYHSASGDVDPTLPTIGLVPRGARLRDRFSYPESMPHWMSAEDLDFYVAELERTGLAGALNRYRNMDRDWEDLAAFHHRPIEIPALFLGGDRDGPTVLGRAAIDRFGENLPRLHRSRILEGCGHWIQQERADEVNEELLDFLASLD